MRKYIIIVVFLFLLLPSLFVIDYTRVRRNTNPIFVIEISDNEDYSYSIGLFYGVYENRDDRNDGKFNDPLISYSSNQYSKYQISPWFVKKK